MKLSLLATGLLFIFITPVVSLKDFKPAFGKWNGSLTYLDYTSGKPYTMPCNITISAGEPKQLAFAYEYPNEPKANGNDTLVIGDDGKKINKDTVISKRKKKGVIEIITERNDVDGNDRKKAVIRHIYTISKSTFSNRKEVKFEGEERWILRNEYKMSRR